MPRLSALRSKGAALTSRDAAPDSALEPVLISLGSNVQPRRNLRSAVDQLSHWFPLCGVSRVYESAPVGGGGSPRFLNAAVLVQTALPPARFKYDYLRPLEERLGRVRGLNKFAPRTIDLDIAIFGALVVDDLELVIPDPEILTRAHVALPLADIAPEFKHPITGERLASIAARFQNDPGVRPAVGVSLASRS